MAGLLAARGPRPGVERIDRSWLLGQGRRASRVTPTTSPPRIHGGFVIGVRGPTGGPCAVRRAEVRGDVAVVVSCTETPVATRAARSLLPAEVPHADAAANAGRAALLVHALATAPGLLLAAHRGLAAPGATASRRCPQSFELVDATPRAAGSRRRSAARGPRCSSSAPADLAGLEAADRAPAVSASRDSAGPRPARLRRSDAHAAAVDSANLASAPTKPVAPDGPVQVAPVVTRGLVGSASHEVTAATRTRRQALASQFTRPRVAPTGRAVRTKVTHTTVSERARGARTGTGTPTRAPLRKDNM